MTEREKKAGNKEKKRKATERRASRRFAWLGPMMERRETKPVPVEEKKPEKGEKED